MKGEWRVDREQVREEPFSQRAQPENRQRRARPVGCSGLQGSSDLTLLPSTGTGRRALWDSRQLRITLEGLSLPHQEA